MAEPKVHPLHVYCQKIVDPGTGRYGAVWCKNKAVAPDPRNPKSSLCARHLAEVTHNGGEAQ